MSDQDSASSNNVVDLSARRNSSINMEGYSLLPDIIWTPEMMKSQYGKVIFTNVRESYSATEDLLCTYTILPGLEVRNDDRVAIFCVGWARIDQVITWVPAALRPSGMEDLSVIFPATSGSHEVSSSPSKLPRLLKFQRYARRLNHADKHREVSLYLSITANEKDAEAEADILGWWQEQEKTLPSLACVAMSILCVPASSGSSERNLSAAGSVDTERRNRLDPNVVDDILLVHSNNDLLSTCDID